MKANYETPKEETSVEMGDLYSVNKQLMKNEPLMTKQEIEDAVGEASDWIKEVAQTNDRYFMLLCHERRDYTLFNLCCVGGMAYVDTANIIVECIQNRGDLLAMDVTEDKTALEIWMRDINDEPFCDYFFPYNEGVIEV